MVVASIFLTVAVLFLVHDHKMIPRAFVWSWTGGTYGCIKGLSVM